MQITFQSLLLNFSQCPRLKLWCPDNIMHPNLSTCFLEGKRVTFLTNQTYLDLNQDRHKRTRFTVRNQSHLKIRGQTCLEEAKWSRANVLWGDTSINQRLFHIGALGALELLQKFHSLSCTRVSSDLLPQKLSSCLKNYNVKTAEKKNSTVLTDLRISLFSSSPVKTIRFDEGAENYITGVNS